ncbi:pyranose 2-oxidase [Ceratobasidium sp. AG-I]|nr:pyranose 2-oxidase [Ceratobasidium sp. AG-I]
MEKKDGKVVNKCNVFIAGSGPIGAAFARTILEKHPAAKVIMCEIGSQDSPVVGAHHKNSVKYQKDIDAFVHVIQGALQPVSVPPSSTHMATLGTVAWTSSKKNESIQGPHNPQQKDEDNLPGCAVTRTVGGMATHWTCACPRPHQEERNENPIPNDEFDQLLTRSEKLLNVHDDQYDNSVRQHIVKTALAKEYGEDRVKSLPLAVERNKANPEYVTWSGTNTVLGEECARKLILKSETRVTKLLVNEYTREIYGALCRDLKSKKDFLVQADKYVIACGAVCTPQILHNSGIRPEALGKNLCEQSIAFCQIVLKRELVQNIPPHLQKKIDAHMKKNKGDSLPIPFNDPEPQVTIPYSTEAPWHTQIHRDAFSYGDVGPRADPRVIVDLRYFGKQEAQWDNRVDFAEVTTDKEDRKNTDLYGMPQPTFHVKRSEKDGADDHRMMLEMCKAANVLGAFLPGSNPQLMAPGLALHITGTTRLGETPQDSVANINSQVHGYNNVYVGGNGCIRSSTACNPTLTSVAIALKAADHISSSLTPEMIEAVKGQPQCVVSE